MECNVVLKHHQHGRSFGIKRSVDASCGMLLKEDKAN